MRVGLPYDDPELRVDQTFGIYIYIYSLLPITIYYNIIYQFTPQAVADNQIMYRDNRKYLTKLLENQNTCLSAFMYT